MVKLSVVVLTKNEEENLPRALRSVRSLADELIVLDSGSTDGTVKVAESFGAKVFKREFDDFASQRNYALSLARGEFVLFLDADEELSEELRESVKRELRSPRALPDKQAHLLYGKLLKGRALPRVEAQALQEGRG